jgi:hypothetical protein
MLCYNADESKQSIKEILFEIETNTQISYKNVEEITTEKVEDNEIKNVENLKN